MEETAEQQPEEMPFFSKLLGVFFEPRRVFMSLNKKPDFIIPLVIMMVVALISTFVGWPIIEKYSLEMQTTRMEERGMTPEQIDQMLNMQKGFMKIFALAGSSISILLITLIVAGILLFVGNIIMGGDANYKKMLSLYSYSSLIGIFSHVVNLVLMLKKQTMEVYTSLAAFFPASAKESILFKIAGVFDIFMIWQLMVVAIGMSVMYQITTRKSFIVIGILYILFSAIAIALGGGLTFTR